MEGIELYESDPEAEVLVGGKKRKLVKGTFKDSRRLLGTGQLFNSKFEFANSSKWAIPTCFQDRSALVQQPARVPAQCEKIVQAVLDSMQVEPKDTKEALLKAR